MGFEMKRKIGTMFEIYIDIRGISKDSCLRYQELVVGNLYLVCSVSAPGS